MIYLNCTGSVSVHKLKEFMEWFGEVESAWVEDGPPYSVGIEFRHLSSRDQLLLWPHPLWINGVRLTLATESLPRSPSFLCTPVDTLAVPLSPRGSCSNQSCLAIYYIPTSWQAHDLYTLLSEDFPNSISGVMVSLDSYEGYKRGIVELKHSVVALELLLAVSREFDGTRLCFSDCMLATISRFHPDTLLEFDVFPFFPAYRNETLITMEVCPPVSLSDRPLGRLTA